MLKGKGKDGDADGTATIEVASVWDQLDSKNLKNKDAGPHKDE